MIGHHFTEVAVGIDVGGTTVAAAPVTIEGTTLGAVVEAASPSTESSERIITQLADIALAARAQANYGAARACGISMPAPFDYQNGISHITHKFQSIQGLPIGEILAEATGMEVYWLNDADAFGIGAASWVLKSISKAQRIIGITIGTGLGGSFMEDGGVVDGHDERIPRDGEIWDLPYDGDILENCVSGPGVANLYKDVAGATLSAKDVAELARTGDKDAAATYAKMGQILGDNLALLSADFKPDAVVVGGNVARSFDLFGPTLRQALARHDMTFAVVQAPLENLAIKGAAQHALLHYTAA